ncbi:MAG TPA: hypothetical protein VGC70_07885, partial [Burkholderiales bacterium]
VVRQEPGQKPREAHECDQQIASEHHNRNGTTGYVIETLFVITSAIIALGSGMLRANSVHAAPLTCAENAVMTMT